MQLLSLYRAGRSNEAQALAAPFLEFERVRARLGGIQVLHSAIGAAGIADMGPLMPMISVVEPQNMAEVAKSVAALVAAEKAATREPALG